MKAEMKESLVAIEQAAQALASAVTEYEAQLKRKLQELYRAPYERAPTAQMAVESAVGQKRIATAVVRRLNGLGLGWVTALTRREDGSERSDQWVADFARQIDAAVPEDEGEAA